MENIKTESFIQNQSLELPLSKRFIQNKIGEVVSKITRYYDETVQLSPLSHDPGYILSKIDCPSKTSYSTIRDLPDFSQDKDKRHAIFFNGNFNHSFDIQHLLEELKPKLARTDRVIAVAYNPYFSWLYRFATFIGFRKGQQPSTFLTINSLTNIAQLSGYDLVQLRPSLYFPWKWLEFGEVLNKILSAVPILKWFGLITLVVLRPIKKEIQKPSLSVIIPARNEKGNIENALKRMPNFGTKMEIIFVEGHSTDQTWEEIERCIQKYSKILPPNISMHAHKQSGKGKANAVRVGFAQASCDLLTILDADLTMPPEQLGRFYEAYRQGLGDFINGTRLVYPMEGEAMRFLNRLGNIFFAKALSWVLDVRLADSLCGTKLVARHDYARMVKWRGDFGEFDPFGDFEILYPAAILALGVIDIPIRYKARTYGTTNIHRFRHGFMLLKMTLIGLLRIKLKN